MKHTVLTALLLTLAACATSTPVQTGDGNWMVSARVPFSGQTGALNQALDEANKFCAAHSQVVRMITNTAQECALHGGCGEAQVTFTCVAPSK